MLLQQLSDRLRIFSRTFQVTEVAVSIQTNYECVLRHIPAEATAQ